MGRGGGARPPAEGSLPRPAVPCLEVIVTSLEDACAAERGGADRLEVVATMEADGLSPDPELVSRLRDAVALPFRVMLRSRPDFAAGADELATLCRTAERLRAVGAKEFVFGFLTADGQLDRAAMRDILAAAAPRRWTMHRVFDRVADAERAWTTCHELPGLDLILSAGSPVGLADGLEQLCRRAAWQTADLRWLAGGGLRSEHIPTLWAAGITQFHTGRAVRRAGSWDGPVDETLVRQLKAAILNRALPDSLPAATLAPHHPPMGGVR